MSKLPAIGVFPGMPCFLLYTGRELLLAFEAFWAHDGTMRGLGRLNTFGREICMQVERLPGEKWWGGNASEGCVMPYKQFSHNLLGYNKGNQSMPLLVSNAGRVIYSEEPFQFSITDDQIEISHALGEVVAAKVGETLRDAYLGFVREFAVPSGRIPDPLLFTMPQYNTWIELTYDQNEDAILAYARSLVAAGYPPGVLMIDDTWQENYGVWEFSPRRFRDPRGMIEQLHAMGFKVMLWVCPFVSADSVEGRMLAREGAVVMEREKGVDVMWADTSNKAAPIRWWNGVSFCLDYSHPKAVAWFKGRLDYLQEQYGVDGFKFDAGDALFYKDEHLAFYQKWHANHHMEAFARIALDYPLNELRACWKLGNQPLAQRLKDKRHNWDDMQDLIPCMIAQGLLGYGFNCPDMIGGGEYQSFLKVTNVDQELFVRSAQASALMPMMQFSASPIRVLDGEHQAYCLAAARLHASVGHEILGLAEACARTGEPILRSMEYAYPGCEYAEIKDQFLLGNDILVAPVLESGRRSRMVHIPEGRWVRQDAEGCMSGPCHVELSVPLANLCWFRRAT
jgi:alpha-glucosidase (family GH31 glycosyl hydrolase)